MRAQAETEKNKVQNHVNSLVDLNDYLQFLGQDFSKELEFLIQKFIESGRKFDESDVFTALSKQYKQCALELAYYQGLYHFIQKYAGRFSSTDECEQLLTDTPWGALIRAESVGVVQDENREDLIKYSNYVAYLLGKALCILNTQNTDIDSRTQGEKYLKIAGKNDHMQATVALSVLYNTGQIEGKDVAGEALDMFEGTSCLGSYYASRLYYERTGKELSDINYNLTSQLKTTIKAESITIIHEFIYYLHVVGKVNILLQNDLVFKQIFVYFQYMTRKGIHSELLMGDIHIVCNLLAGLPAEQSKLMVNLSIKMILQFNTNQTLYLLAIILGINSEKYLADKNPTNMMLQFKLLIQYIYPYLQAEKPEVEKSVYNYISKMIPYLERYVLLSEQEKKRLGKIDDKVMERLLGKCFRYNLISPIFMMSLINKYNISSGLCDLLRSEAKKASTLNKDLRAEVSKLTSDLSLARIQEQQLKEKLACSLGEVDSRVSSMQAQQKKHAGSMAALNKRYVQAEALCNQGHTELVELKVKLGAQTDLLTAVRLEKKQGISEKIELNALVQEKLRIIAELKKDQQAQAEFYQVQQAQISSKLGDVQAELARVESENAILQMKLFTSESGSVGLAAKLKIAERDVLLLSTEISQLKASLASKTSATMYNAEDSRLLASILTANPEQVLCIAEGMLQKGELVSGQKLLLKLRDLGSLRAEFHTLWMQKYPEKINDFFHAGDIRFIGAIDRILPILVFPKAHRLLRHALSMINNSGEVCSYLMGSCASALVLDFLYGVEEVDVSAIIKKDDIDIMCVVEDVDKFYSYLNNMMVRIGCLVDRQQFGAVTHLKVSMPDENAPVLDFGLYSRYGYEKDMAYSSDIRLKYSAASEGFNLSLHELSQESIGYLLSAHVAYKGSSGQYPSLFWLLVLYVNRLNVFRETAGHLLAKFKVSISGLIGQVLQLDGLHSHVDKDIVSVLKKFISTSDMPVIWEFLTQNKFAWGVGEKQDNIYLIQLIDPMFKRLRLNIIGKVVNYLNAKKEYSQAHKLFLFYASICEDLLSQSSGDKSVIFNNKVDGLIKIPISKYQLDLSEILQGMRCASTQYDALTQSMFAQAKELYARVLGEGNSVNRGSVSINGLYSQGSHTGRQEQYKDKSNSLGGEKTCKMLCSMGVASMI